MPTLHIYNSLSRKKQVFVPIEEGKIGMYVCGMTIYDYCHLGHARMIVAFDVIVRFLRSLGYEVNYVRNITDIDDKIIARANHNKEAYTDLTDRFTRAMHEDFVTLNVLSPSIEPRATAHIDDIINMILKLEEKGYTYQGETGDVYYRVRKFEKYGQLSGKNVDELRSGARIEQDASKQDPVDFVLWKSAKAGEPFWESPWGNGRPGWHIECSAMATQCIADHFDIHGGGMDLQFPHHENEIAQSEAATGCTFANYWLHNGFVQIDEEKMSKSLGNFFTIREILAQDKQPERMGEVIRFMLLASHYRSPLNYSGLALENARTALERIYKVIERAEGVELGRQEDAIIDNQWTRRFKSAMCDDFNTPEAIAVVFDLVREINRRLDAGEPDDTEISVFKQICASLGIGYQSPAKFLGSAVEDKDAVVVEQMTAADIEILLDERALAKLQKNWARADEIRDQLTELGINIEDKPDGRSIWSFAG